MGWGGGGERHSRQTPTHTDPPPSHNRPPRPPSAEPARAAPPCSTAAPPSPGPGEGGAGRRGGSRRRQPALPARRCPPTPARPVHPLPGEAEAMGRGAPGPNPALPEEAPCRRPRRRARGGTPRPGREPPTSLPAGKEGTQPSGEGVGAQPGGSGWGEALALPRPQTKGGAGRAPQPRSRRGSVPRRLRRLCVRLNHRDHLRRGERGAHPLPT